MARTWAQLVTEGRRLVSLEGDIKWQLGDLALEVAPVAVTSGPNGGAYKKLEQYADEIGVKFDALRNYRDVANAWPFAKRFANAAWSVHDILRGRSDRFALIKSLERDGQGKVRTTTAWRAIGTTVGPSNTNMQSPKAERVEAARQYMADPAVRRDLVRDDHVRADWSRTVREEDARTAATVARKIRESAPKLVEAREFYEAVARAQHARRDIRNLIEALVGLPPLDTEQRAMVRHELDLITQALDYAQSMVRGRQSASLTDEISVFLAGEAS